MQHIDAAINLLRLRYQTHPKWFRSERMCFLDTIFTEMWCGAYDKFKNFELPPPLGRDYCLGDQPEFCKSQKVWGKDVDDIYTCLNIKDKHWVALWISIPERNVVIWDCYQKFQTAEYIATLVNCLCEMIPYMLHILCPVEERHVFSKVPYTQKLLPKDQVPQNAKPGDCGLFCMKFIECHALGLPFSSKNLCDRNMPRIRKKLAAEIYAELKITGKEKREYKGLDLYDSLEK